MSEGLGFSLVILGMACALSLNREHIWLSLISSDRIHAFILLLALLVYCFHELRTEGSSDRSNPATLILTAPCLLAGVIALWHLATDNKASDPSTISDGLPWAPLLGCVAVLIATRRLWGATLAFAGLAAMLYIMSWRIGFDPLIFSSPDLFRDIAATLSLAGLEGTHGWLPDALASTVLPFLVLDAMLARLFADDKASSNLADNRLALGQVLVPTFFVSLLMMTKHPDIDMSAGGTSWVFSIGLCLSWLARALSMHKLMARFGKAERQRLLLSALALVSLFLAVTSGLSLQGSTMIALGVIVLLSLFDSEIRHHPMTFLHAFARCGALFAALLIAMAATGMIVSVLDRTDLPVEIAQVLVGASGEAWLPILVLGAIVSFCFAAVMPSLAAYLIAASVMSPALRTSGLSDLTIHLVILSVSVLPLALAALSMTPSIGTSGLRIMTSIGGKARHGVLA